MALKLAKKIFSLSSVFTLSAVASVALAAPQDSSQLRLRRDVSELLSMDASVPLEYVPPAMDSLLPVDGEVEEPSAVRGEQGYEYRTVRRLKLRHRNRRDVSHLPATQYLPPPSNKYLPPGAEGAPATAPAAAPAPIDDTEEVVAAALPKVARDYLPPVSTEAAPQLETEAPVVVEEEEQPQADVPTAELRDDGYHYKQPMEDMQLQLKQAAPEYLPPLGDEVVVDGPVDGESAVLNSDGYQYRAIRRFRF
ncbi:GH15897 [Drosophila grimshawi]|uniref:GH15897 n=1 Tax=Drosophila grimshawi TaxID=7222 RepID=B4J0W6_DROGR|nr:GH15897 [Drosophila grimshawi]